MDFPGLRVSRKTFPQLAKRIPFLVSNFDHPSGIANLATGLEFSTKCLVASGENTRAYLCRHSKATPGRSRQS